MTFANQSQINRLNKEIADLRKAESQATRKEADVRAKINRAEEAAGRARNISTLQNKTKETEGRFCSWLGGGPSGQKRQGLVR